MTEEIKQQGYAHLLFDKKGNNIHWGKGEETFISDSRVQSGLMTESKVDWVLLCARDPCSL